MPLILILGSMYSGKTSELLRRVDKLRAIHKKVLLVRSIIDTRNHAKVIQTHAGHAKPSATFHTLQDVPYDQYDAIAIDEGQFFDDEDFHVKPQERFCKKSLLALLNMLAETIESIILNATISSHMNSSVLLMLFRSSQKKNQRF